MYYAYNPGTALAGLGIMIFFIAVAFAIARCADNNSIRTRKYRKEMVDMYVVGKTKQIAKKEGIDLLQEFKEFTKINKQKNINHDALDLTIEKELQEKIQKEAEEKGGSTSGSSKEK